MARPVNRRVIEKPPIMEGFKPFGIPMHDLEPVVLLFEEFEALRLADYLALSHRDGARRMNVSRPTFTRICDKARRTLATALVEGKALFIEGGTYQTEDYWYRCEGCWKLVISADETSACPYCRATTVRRLNPEPPCARPTDIASAPTATPGFPTSEASPVAKAAVPIAGGACSAKASITTTFT